MKILFKSTLTWLQILNWKISNSNTKPNQNHFFSIQAINQTKSTHFIPKNFSSPTPLPKAQKTFSLFGEITQHTLSKAFTFRNCYSTQTTNDWNCYPIYMISCIIKLDSMFLFPFFSFLHEKNSLSSLIHDFYKFSMVLKSIMICKCLQC